MPNVPRRDAHPEKYEGKTLLDYEEAMDYLGIRRSSLYTYLTELDLPTKKFKRDRRRYLPIETVQLLERIITTPGLYEQCLEEHKRETSEETGNAA